MKILAIRIKNLASLEGITEIDFTSEPLASAGIFAITGPTGAGKSTLLDALCLALYGKTPRYLQAKEMGIEIQDVQGSTMSQGDIRGILRDGTSDGYAEVDFVGIDHQFYRTHWSVRRARNKADGSMQADAIALKNISSNLDLPGKKAETYKEIERLVGLNFEQFTRSVLLAQGDFTAFMKANKDEKSSLLEKLTGTHIYSEISKKIFENYRNQESLLRELNMRSQGITTFSEEQLVEIKTEEAVLAQQFDLLSVELNALSKEINWHEQFLQLETGKATASKNVALTELLLKESEERKNKFIQVEQAQNTRTWNDALMYNQKQFSTQKVQLEALKIKLAALLEQEKTLEELFKKEELQLFQVIENQKDAFPKLAAAKKLDTLISEKEKQIKTAQSEVDLAKSKQENHQKEVLQKEVELSKIATEIQVIQDWQNKFESKKTIANHKDLIVSKLLDAEKLLLTNQKSDIERKNVVQKINETTLKIAKFSTDFEALENILMPQEKAYHLKFNSVLLIPIEKINLEKTTTDHSINATVQAESLWNILEAENKNIAALRQKQTLDQTDVTLKNKLLQEQKTQLNLFFIAKETSEKLLQKARLSATESVENLREALIDNEPCMVCGSENHPYALQNPQLEKVLSDLEEMHQNNEKSYLEAFGTCNRLEQECTLLNKTIEQQKNEIKTKNILSIAKKQAWELNPISKECQTIIDAEKSSWFYTKIKDLKDLQTDLQNQIKAHFEEKKQLDKDKIQLDVLKDKKTLLLEEITTLKSQLAVLNEQFSSIKKSILQNETALKTNQNSISTYFQLSDWVKKWQENPTAFVTSILTFSEEWKLKSEQLEERKNQQSLQSANVAQLKTQAKSLNEEMVLKTTHFNVLSASFEVQKAERKLIFEGKSAESMDVYFADAVEKTQKTIQVTNTKLQQNKLDLATVSTSIKEMETNNSKTALEIDNLNVTIQKWLSKYNEKQQQSLTFSDLDTLLQFSSEWIETERNALNSLVEEKTKATSILLERTENYKKHVAKRPSERLLDDLKLAFEQAKTQNEICTQEKATIQIKLAQDIANKEKLGGLLHEIEVQAKITDNWHKLNELIGSSDGKKFRQIAQEYTLEVLLSYANLHLKDLTNRYKMERIPNTLGLQVVDQDMGDEIRTVYSLSGGESFLVSLALALGLASLSSSKMKVESLFIDEGFGSLDPNTLNIAMDALERLHNLGRKVGVISHVQEMTERIPVQIKVSKKTSGRSKVEVLDLYH